MRSLASIAVLGTFVFAAGAPAQSLSEHAAAAAGATIGTAAGKPLSNAITKIFGTVDTDAKKAAGAKPETKTMKIDSSAAPTAPAANPLANASAGSSGYSVPSSSHASSPSRRRAAAPQGAEYQAVNPSHTSFAIEAPVVKEPTSEELVSVKVGATERDVLATLGQPASRITIPDDGHLLEICQYWAKGKQLGTIRLDNGQVVTVEPTTEN